MVSEFLFLYVLSCDGDDEDEGVGGQIPPIIVTAITVIIVRFPIAAEFGDQVLRIFCDAIDSDSDDKMNRSICCRPVCLSG